jgi:hypothetical protein
MICFAEPVLIEELYIVQKEEFSIICCMCDTAELGAKIFLDLSSSNIDTLVPSLYNCIETRKIEVF